MTRAALNSPSASPPGTMIDRATPNGTSETTAAPEHVDPDLIPGAGAPTSRNVKLTIALAVLGVFVTYIPIPQ